MIAGIPNPQPTTHMNISPLTPNSEPRWATYFKAATFAFPAAFIWLFSVVFIIPKLQELCQHAGIALFAFKDAPGVFQAFAFVGRACLSSPILDCMSVRPSCWFLACWNGERAGGRAYRRAVLGAGTFLLNLAVLISITLMVISAIVAVSMLHQIK